VDFARRIHDVVRQVPPGRVITYGDVAWAAGRPGAARAVGRVMAKTPAAADVPCHRVVRMDGTVADEELAARLRKEGVDVWDCKVLGFDVVRWAQPGD
jgi:O-6-methylguanine DNA methyltransferase